jgi:hypothetical protein
MRVAGSALVTDSHAKHEPAPGELVDGSGLARDVPRPPPRERNDFDAQGHAARAHGRGGEDGPRIAGRPCGVALVADVVLEEDAVPPGLFREDCELEQEARITAFAARRQCQPVAHERTLRARDLTEAHILVTPTTPEAAGPGHAHKSALVVSRPRLASADLSATLCAPAGAV